MRRRSDCDVLSRSQKKEAPSDAGAAQLALAKVEVNKGRVAQRSRRPPKLNKPSLARRCVHEWKSIEAKSLLQPGLDGEMSARFVRATTHSNMSSRAQRGLLPQEENEEEEEGSWQDLYKAAGTTFTECHEAQHAAEEERIGSHCGSEEDAPGSVSVLPWLTISLQVSTLLSLKRLAGVPNSDDDVPG